MSGSSNDTLEDFSRALSESPESELAKTPTLDTSLQKSRVRISSKRKPPSRKKMEGRKTMDDSIFNVETEDDVADGGGSKSTPLRHTKSEDTPTTNYSASKFQSPSPAGLRSRSPTRKPQIGTPNTNFLKDLNAALGKGHKGLRPKSPLGARASLKISRSRDSSPTNKSKAVNEATTKKASQNVESKGESASEREGPDAAEPIKLSSSSGDDLFGSPPPMPDEIKVEKKDTRCDQRPI